MCSRLFCYVHFHNVNIIEASKHHQIDIGFVADGVNFLLKEWNLGKSESHLKHTERVEASGNTLFLETVGSRHTFQGGGDLTLIFSRLVNKMKKKNKTHP